MRTLNNVLFFGCIIFGSLFEVNTFAESSEQPKNDSRPFEKVLRNFGDSLKEGKKREALAECSTISDENDLALAKLAIEHMIAEDHVLSIAIQKFGAEEVEKSMKRRVTFHRRLDAWLTDRTVVVIQDDGKMATLSHAKPQPGDESIRFVLSGGAWKLDALSLMHLPANSNKESREVFSKRLTGQLEILRALADEIESGKIKDAQNWQEEFAARTMALIRSSATSRPSQSQPSTRPISK